MLVLTRQGEQPLQAGHQTFVALNALGVSLCLQAKYNSGMSSTGVLSHKKVHILLNPVRHDAALSTHVVLSEFIDGDLCLHEVVVEDDDFPAEGSLFLFMMVGLQHERKYGQGTIEEGKKRTKVVRG